jgi:hypothetical protein
VVETSPHSLIARYGCPGRKFARGGPLYWFSHRIHADVLDSPGKSAHANSTFKGPTTPWHEPDRIKMVYDRGVQARFD